MSAIKPFAQLLHAFFYDWLIAQRNTSRHTIISYRDSWRLFLRFVAQRQHTAVAKLALEHLVANEVLAFLDHLEQDRHVLPQRPRDPRPGPQSASGLLCPESYRDRRGPLEKRSSLTHRSERVRFASRSI